MNQAKRTHFLRSKNRTRGERRRLLRVELLEDRRLLAANAIVAENLLPGSPASEWDIVGSGDPSLQGYATDISVDQGSSVAFKINNPTLAPYRLDIYRIGYYGGDGARKVATIPSSVTLRQSQPAPLTNAATGLIDAGNWSVSASWDVPQTATSGVYVAKATREDTGGASHIIFVVRDDDGQSEMLFQTADTTWQAYNSWGGNSLYTGPLNGRSYAVSYNRPFNTRDITAKDWFFSSEYAMVRFMEKNGYDVSYSTGVDSDRRGHELLEHEVFLSVGHDEYWSAAQRANVEAARDAGVHLAFFSGNEVYWKTRWENSTAPGGTPFRTLVTYKETWANTKIDPAPNVWTGTWRDGRFSPPADGGLPENALTGQIFTVNRGPGGDTGTPFEVPAEYADLRFWRDTRVANLQPGTIATIGDYVLGYEWDEDLDNGFRPDGLFRMSSTTQNVPQKIDQYGGPTTTPGLATHSITLYRAESGALVFGAGTVQWAWGLDGTHDVIASVPDTALQQATVNLFADMGVQPQTLQAGLAYASMSVDVQAPVSTITSPANGATLSNGSSITISGTASDNGGVVAGVEVSVDGGSTWHRAQGRTNWSYSWNPNTIGPLTVYSRAVDDSANLEVATNGVNVTVQFAPTSTNGLIAAYNFNASSGSTLADASGNNHTGSVSGAVFAPGFRGNALSFDGVNDLVTIADTNALDLSSGMSLEAWIRPADLQGWSSVLLKERDSNGLAYGLYASDNTANPPAGYIHTNGSDHGAVGTSALTVNSWNHLATTYDGQSLRLYVNGALVTSHEVSGNISSSGQPLRLGGNTVFADEYFSGLIDDVRIYNRPLTHGEVLYNMSTPVGGTPDSTAPTASISSPANGATVSGQVMVNVTATDNVAVGAVRLRINGAPWGTDTQAPYQILLDTRQLPNGSYTLSGEVQDVIGNVTSLASRTIHVANATDTTPPTLTLLNPDAGQQVAGEVVLSAFSADDVAVAGVQFRVDGNNLGGEDNAAPYQRVWNTATVADGPHQIEVISRDASGNTTSQSLSLIVDNTAPTLSSQTPNAGASSVSPSIQPSAVFSEDIRASVSQFELRDSGGGLVAASVQYDSNLRKLSLIPDQSLLLDEIYSVSLSGVQDLAGNAAAAISWSFSTGNTQGDTVPPTLASHQPASGAVDIAINTTVLATFSEPIQPATLSFVLRDASNNVVGASVSYNNVTREASLSPNLPLADYSTYTATVSGAMDIAGNKMQPVSWTFTTSSFAPVLVSSYPEPSSTNFPPSADLSVTFSEPIVFATLNFVLTGPGGQNIAGAVSYDNSIRTATFNPSQELAPQTVYSVSVSAQDAEGNSSNSQWSFTSGAALSGLTIWNTSTTPAVASANDTSAVELGVKFRADLDGFVTGLRFYKGPFNTGTHSGHIWAADGTLLGSATFTNEASGGWQQVDFDSPIAIVANATYVASYYAPNGGYAYDSGYFSGGSVTNGHLTALGQGVQGGNGVYRYGVGGGFPSLSFNATNYWIDVVFATSLADSTAPTVTSQSPPPGATNIATNTSVAATFSEAVEATSIVFSLRDANGDVVPSVLSYDNNTQTASLTPNAVLQGGVTYTATLGGARDSAGNAMATVNWSFTTGGLVSNASLWNQNTIPAVSSSNDSAAVELGVKFRADRDGFLQGIRFYKGNANTGTHVGNLWSADGSLLASATFTNETALGWQTVNFALPVAITADTTYVASYFAPNGGYAYNHGYFATAFVNGALRALATGEDGGNGVYRYGSSSAFPSEFYNSSNYWVDVVFSQSLDDTQPPTLLNQSPAPASFGIATHADITAVFSEAVQPATISFQLHDQWNNLVPADVSYDIASGTVRLNPAAELLPLTTYQATLQGATDAAGNAMNTVNWSFTVQGKWTQTTRDDFSAGVHDGTVASDTGGGALQLATTFADEFDGTALNPANWGTGAWSPESAVSVQQGTLSVQGGQVLSVATYAPQALEGLVNFGASPYQHFGLATGFETEAGNYWAIFSSGNTSNTLFARVNALGATQQVNLGALPTGYHTYQIHPTSSGFEFYVDGNLQASLAGAFPGSTQMRIALSAYNAAPAPALRVDSLRLLTVAANADSNGVRSGIYQSVAFDAGQTVNWQSVVWTAEAPAGTGIKIEILISDDANFSGATWLEVSNGQSLSALSLQGRYLKYRVTLTTTDELLSPKLLDLEFTWF